MFTNASLNIVAEFHSTKAFIKGSMALKKWKMENTVQTVLELEQKMRRDFKKNYRLLLIIFSTEEAQMCRRVHLNLQFFKE